MSAALLTLLKSKFVSTQDAAALTVKPTVTRTKSDVDPTTPVKKAEDPPDQIAAAPGLGTRPTSGQPEAEAGSADISSDISSDSTDDGGGGGNGIVVLEQIVETDAPDDRVVDAAEVAPVDPTLATYVQLSTPFCLVWGVWDGPLYARWLAPRALRFYCPPPPPSS